MATQINRIPLPSVALVDINTGVINPYWYDFFASLAGGQPLKNFADDTAAAAGGIALNGFYRTGSIVKIRVT
jgi:hypothetical protein